MSTHVTIVMPVYNAAQYLAEAMDSILCQSHRHFTLIVVDDGSTDNTAEILDIYSAQDQRIRILRNSHRGTTEALMRGVEAADTEWIFRMDADDIAYPDRLVRQLQFIQHNPRVRVTSCMAEYIGDTGKTIGRTVNLVPNELALKQRLDAGLLVPLLHPGALMHRETILGAGGYRPQFRVSQDLDLWTRVAETGALVIAMDDVLMKYRIHPGSSFVAAPIKVLMGEQWILACAKARQTGKPEPTWEDFHRKWKASPATSRFNQMRSMYARTFYRTSGMNFVNGKYVHSVFHLLAAALSAPAYTFSRFYKQVLDNYGH